MSVRVPSGGRPRAPSDGHPRPPGAPDPVALPRPELASAAEVEDLAAAAEANLAAFARERRGVRGDGQDNGGAGNLEVNERRAAVSALRARLDPAGLARALGAKGKLGGVLAKDVAWLESAERQALSRDRPFELGWAKNGTSTPKVLAELAARRAIAAAEAARELSADPRAAFDATNGTLLAHLEAADPDVRARILTDSVIQFRARRRSGGLMDRRAGAGAGERDSTEGRIASSGPIAALEQRLAAQELPRGRSLAARREHALLRLAITNHPNASTNGIFWARNAVALLASDRYLGRQLRNRPVGQGEGLEISLYDAIHKNYSANTPKVVEHFLTERAFTFGPRESRLAILTACVDAANDPELAAAKRTLQHLQRTYGVEIPGAAAAGTSGALARAILGFLRANTGIPALARIKLEDAPFVYRALVDLGAATSAARPTDRSLERELFYAGRAWPEVARVIHALRAGDHPATVEALGRARTSLQRAFDAAESGFDRQMMLRLDRQLELLSAEVLGVAVSRAGEDLGADLLALRSALRGVLASGLDTLRSRARTATAPPLDQLLRRADRLLANDHATAAEIRDLAADVFRSATEVGETMRSFFAEREHALHFSGVDVTLDPELTDNLVKETALHYLLALSQSAMMHGLEVKASADELRFVSGMRVLSSVGPTVYKRVLVAKDLDRLLRLGPGNDDFCIVHNLDEKNMVAVGGLLADTKDAPGGYSHLSVFAKGHGISALAFPDVATAYADFFENVEKGGGLYVDDRRGSFVMKPLDRAIASGLVDPERIDALRPGFNHEIRYLRHDGVKAEVAGAHDVHLSDERSTRRIELYVPELEARDPTLGRALGFDALDALPFPRTRHLAGEKGAVLAHLASLPELRALGVEVPGGAVLPPYEVASLLRKAGVYDRWMSPWLQDPDVGEVTSENLLRSRFYTDRTYRLDTAKKLRREVEKGLRKLLLQGGKPTREGKQLLDALAATPALAGARSWIARSSFTGEDRPNKSGAGQYESFAGLRAGAARLDGIIGVITSAFGDTPIENNVQMQVDLRQIWPSVLVESCIDAELSGVAVSRGPKGELGQVSYQSVPGFGGGVAGGRPEEGTLDQAGVKDLSLLRGRERSLLTPAQAEQLRKAVLAIEAEFNRTIEPGQGYAVDVEWAIAGGKLHIVQARVIV